MSSYTNVLDADVALELARRFVRAAAVIVKHGTPCGVALGDTPGEAYLRALAADPKAPSAERSVLIGRWMARR